MQITSQDASSGETCHLFIVFRKICISCRMDLCGLVIECMGHVCMQRAGLELMDMMAVYQEGAYERLCR